MFRSIEGGGGPCKLKGRGEGAFEKGRAADARTRHGDGGDGEH